MIPTCQVRMATPQDLLPYYEHLKRHSLESGKDGDLIFDPFEDPWDRPMEKLQQEKEDLWQRLVTEVGWERCWILTDGIGVFGDLKLSHAVGLKTSLHRALLTLGIERSHRSQGYGSLLLQNALTWARQQPSLAWIQLNVFDHNQPAKRLYQRNGFQEVGTLPDLFRVYGQKIGDTQMILNLRD